MQLRLPRNMAIAAWIMNLACASLALTQTLPNSEFREGGDSPKSWKSEGEGCRWVDRDILEVTGKGEDTCLWRSDDLRLKSGGLYHFRFRARRVSGAGSAIAGPSFANRDYSDIGPDWKWYGHTFRVPEDGSGYIRLGQWHATGAIQFDSVQLARAIPVNLQKGPLLLGEGEMIREGRYRFVGTFEGPASNYHRTLENATAGFNSTRWTLGNGQCVTYVFGLPGMQFRSGRFSFNVNYHVAGSCIAEVSRDGTQWRTAATIQQVGAAQASIPEDLLSGDHLRLRLRAADASGFQINQVEFEAEVADRQVSLTGETIVADLPISGEPITVDRIVRQERSDGRVALTMTVRNRGKEAVVPSCSVCLAGKDITKDSLTGSLPKLESGKTQAVEFTLPSLPAGPSSLSLAVGTGPAAISTRAEMELNVPDFYRSDYGMRLAETGGDTAVWWCDATRKIPRQRPVPAAVAPAATLSAARHDYEAIQLVVRPDKPLTGLTAKASPLTGPGKAVLPAENIDILRVYYHFVEHPTDGAGVRDWWPDALPTLREPLDVPAGTNQPLWVLVYVPKDAAPGDYEGSVSLKAQGFAAEVPLRLHVWDFALPETNHLQTAFGFSPWTVFEYHNIKSDEDRRKILDMYFESFSRHRISPYDPAPLDDIRVKFVPDANPPRAEVDFTAFDAAFERAVRRFHFNTIRLPIEGMGGGTFHDRVEPKIGAYGEETPQYKAMFASYVKQLEDHFRAKGWLGMPYIYWFDEPEPKDYEFVRRGFERLKLHAPGLRTMLTEEPVDALAGPVNIWCPITPNYDPAQAERRRTAGDEFWWYVCTGPKAPYCTLFIDHPATELRVWHWQTWQREIVGTLVWSSNYWTSETAFPDHPQNPYDDPMGYVSGYSTPKGAKQFWGNGDGRFIYPPLAAAVPNPSAGPVLEPPVSSIRWEMLREGVEDYEYLNLLRELLAAVRAKLPAAEIARYETLLKVPASITSDMTTFAKEPSAIYARRAEIAAAIELLTKIGQPAK